MKTIIWCIIGLFIILNYSIAETGFGFLNIPSGAKQSGLGGQGVSLYSDPFSFIHNAGTLALIKNSAGVNYKNWLSDVTVIQSAGCYRLYNIGSFGLSIQYAGLSFNEYDQKGAVVGETGSKDTLIQAGYGREMLLKNLSLGSSILLLSNSLDQRQQATVFALNFGALYRFDFNVQGYNYYCDTGVSINNIGLSSKYDDFDASIPLKCKIGINTHLPWYNIFVPVEMGLSDNGMDFIMGTGSEYTMRNLGSVSGFFGLPFTDDMRQFTLGLETVYFIDTIKQIKLNFTYEFLKVQNTLNIGIIYGF